LQCLLLDGESGTGKRGLAELFHLASERRKAPMVVASCNELTNETLLRSTLFGHRRGAFTDARDDRAGLVVSAGRGMVLLDDFHRLPTAGTAILHSFLEDGEYSRLGEEEVRRHAEAAVVLTVETGPWAERRRSGELPLSFLARVERLPLTVPPLRDRPEDIEAQARWITRSASMEVGAAIELADDAAEGLKTHPFAESNSRELRNAIERAVVRHKSEIDELTWTHLRPYLAPAEAATRKSVPTPASPPAGTPPLNDWQRRVRALATKLLVKGAKLDEPTAQRLTATLFDSALPPLWTGGEDARARPDTAGPIPWPLWEDLWRCFAIAHLGGPTPAERVLGIPANTLRQWISDHESR
jgi:transcriptional regulator with AAA-type ATPase domain